MTAARAAFLTVALFAVALYALLPSDAIARTFS